MYEENKDIIATMIGKTFESVEGEEGSNEMIFIEPDGSRYTFYHDQDCCERVAIAEIIGDIVDLVESPIREAEEVSSEDEPPEPEDGYCESHTWTFYKFATIKGAVTVRWLGESNGYYSEGVDVRYEPAKKA